MGDGFIARDITVVNSAGPAKHQAVALRVGSDKSVIFRCSIIGYQDTLYTHSKRQFYRETDIYGTVDFIFGNSAVVFQTCNIYARKPMSSSVKNFVTAQGRSSPNQNTGISIHNCKISAAEDLAPVKTRYTFCNLFYLHGICCKFQNSPFILHFFIFAAILNILVHSYLTSHISNFFPI